jgi:hypothetical protein
MWPHCTLFAPTNVSQNNLTCHMVLVLSKFNALKKRKKFITKTSQCIQKPIKCAWAVSY